MGDDEQLVDEETKETEADTPDSRLRKHYIVGLSTVALFAIVFAAIVQYSMHELEMDSRVVNIAGRQRMLSQKLTKIALEIKWLNGGIGTKKHVAEMEKARNRWSRSHDGLKDGDPKMGLPPTKHAGIIKQFESIEPYYQTMHRACDNIVAASSNSDGEPINLILIEENVDSILAAEGSFLEGMNEIVFSFDNNAKSKILVLERTQWIISALILGVLAVVAFIVFEPAVNLIRYQFKKLSAVASERQALIDDLERAIATVKHLKGLLPICASCKKIRDDDGDWRGIEFFIEEHSEAQFSHGICPDCVKRLYPEFKQ